MSEQLANSKQTDRIEDLGVLHQFPPGFQRSLRIDLENLKYDVQIAHFDSQQILDKLEELGRKYYGLLPEGLTSAEVQNVVKGVWVQMTSEQRYAETVGKKTVKELLNEIWPGVYANNFISWYISAKEISVQETDGGSFFVQLTPKYRLELPAFDLKSANVSESDVRQLTRDFENGLISALGRALSAAEADALLESELMEFITAMLGIFTNAGIPGEVAARIHVETNFVVRRFNTAVKPIRDRNGY